MFITSATSIIKAIISLHKSVFFERTFCFLLISSCFPRNSSFWISLWKLYWWCL